MIANDTIKSISKIDGSFARERTTRVHMRKNLRIEKSNLFLPLSGSSLECRDLEGVIKWSFPISYFFGSELCLSNQKVIFSIDNQVFFILYGNEENADSLWKQWVYEASDKVISEIVVDSNRVYLISNDYIFYCVKM